MTSFRNLLDTILGTVRRNTRFAGILLTIILPTAAFLSIAPLTGSALRHSAPSPPNDCIQKTSNELPSIYKVRSASELELDGRIDEAEKAYGAVLTSSNACVRDTAIAGLARFYRLRERLGMSYSVVADLAAISARMLTPIVLVLLVVVAYWSFVRLVPAKGTRIDGFPVYGSDDLLASKQFQDALLWFANDIKRVYSSEYARNVGITLLFDDLQGDSLKGQSVYDEALAELTEPDAKAAVRFAMTHVVRWLRDAVERPEFLVTGDVRLFPGSAKAVGAIVAAKTGKAIRIEASTTEFEELPVLSFIQGKLLNPPAVALDRAPQRKVEEMRRTSSQLYELALLLACKIRFAQSQLAAGGYKPNSWQTLCLYAAGALALE
jgi:hypothetical protein